MCYLRASWMGCHPIGFVTWLFWEEMIYFMNFWLFFSVWSSFPYLLVQTWTIWLNYQYEWYHYYGSLSGYYTPYYWFNSMSFCLQSSLEAIDSSTNSSLVIKDSTDSFALCLIISVAWLTWIIRKCLRPSYGFTFSYFLYLFTSLHLSS